jgi:hypothetical protein
MKEHIVSSEIIVVAELALLKRSKVNFATTSCV